jgi:hypothetical protein
MYVEAIKWAMGLLDADVTPRPLTNQVGIAQNNETGTDQELAAREEKNRSVHAPPQRFFRYSGMEVQSRCGD